jgi:hypothetical protein
MRTVLSARRAAWMIPTLALLACAKKEPAPQAAAAPDTTAMAMTPPPAPVNVTLAAKNRSGITGTATLTKMGDSTQVMETLNGGRNGTKYPSHIHAGTCASPGAVVAPLGSVSVGADKSGSATTMVLTATLDSARAKFGSLLVQSHLPNMRPAACGDIPAQ